MPSSAGQAVVPAEILARPQSDEQTFAKNQALDAGGSEREPGEDTWRHLGYLVETIKPDECENYFRNAGYASVKT